MHKWCEHAGVLVCGRVQNRGGERAWDLLATPLEVLACLHNRDSRACVCTQAIVDCWQASLHASGQLAVFWLAGVAVATVDSVGRRPLLLGGVSGMIVALVGLGVASIQLQGGAAAWTSVAALLAYVGAYQVSVCAYDVGPGGAMRRVQSAECRVQLQQRPPKLARMIGCASPRSSIQQYSQSNADMGLQCSMCCP